MSPRVLIPCAPMGLNTQNDRRACVPCSVGALHSTLSSTHLLQPPPTPPRLPYRCGFVATPGHQLRGAVPPPADSGSPGTAIRSAARREKVGPGKERRGGERKENPFPDTVTGLRANRAAPSACTLWGGGGGGVSKVRTSALRDPQVRPQPTPSCHCDPK